jgi:hypothetical protein
MISFVLLGLEDVIDGGRQGEDHMILVNFLLIIEFELGEGLSKEENLLPAGNGGDVLQFFVDKGMQIGLESLVFE